MRTLGNFPLVYGGVPAKHQTMPIHAHANGSSRQRGAAKSIAAIEPSSAGIARFLDETQRTLALLDQGVLDRIVHSLLDVWRKGRTVFVMGNGGSASTASHFAADLAKYTIAEGKRRFRVIALTDNAALVSAWTNDAGFG